MSAKFGFLYGNISKKKKTSLLSPYKALFLLLFQPFPRNLSPFSITTNHHFSSIFNHFPPLTPSILPLFSITITTFSFFSFFSFFFSFLSSKFSLSNLKIPLYQNHNPLLFATNPHFAFKNSSFPPLSHIFFYSIYLF